MRKATHHLENGEGWSLTAKTTIKGGLSSAPKVDSYLDPSSLSTIGPYHLMHNLGLTLLKMFPTGEIGPWAASEFTKVSSREFVLTLKPGLRYSDGRYIRVSDIVGTLRRVWKKGSVHVPLRQWIGDTEADFESRITIEGERTIRIRLKNPVVNFDYYLQMADTVILTPEQQTVVDRNFTPMDWQVSSGPYVTEAIPDSELGFRLLKNSYCSVCQPNRADFVELTNKAEFDGKSKVWDIANFGTLPFAQYFEMLSGGQAIDPNRFRVSGSRFGFVVTLVLNSASRQWKNPIHREWIRRAIHSRLEISSQYAEFIEPAYMYMLPHAPVVGAGDSHAFAKMAQLDAKSVGEIPHELVGSKLRIILGPAVRARSPHNIEEMLRSALSPLDLEFYWVNDQKELDRIDWDRAYDGWLIAASSSYRSVSESFNLAYLSKFPMALDPTGKIKKLVVDL